VSIDRARPRRISAAAAAPTPALVTPLLSAPTHSKGLATARDGC
jgi:hypothetical protein